MKAPNTINYSYVFNFLCFVVYPFLHIWVHLNIEEENVQLSVHNLKVLRKKENVVEPEISIHNLKVLKKGKCWRAPNFDRMT